MRSEMGKLNNRLEAFSLISWLASCRLAMRSEIANLMIYQRQLLIYQKISHPWCFLVLIPSPDLILNTTCSTSWFLRKFDQISIILQPKKCSFFPIEWQCKTSPNSLYNSVKIWWIVPEINTYIYILMLPKIFLRVIVFQMILKQWRINLRSTAF